MRENDLITYHPIHFCPSLPTTIFSPSSFFFFFFFLSFFLPPPFPFSHLLSCFFPLSLHFHFVLLSPSAFGSFSLFFYLLSCFLFHGFYQRGGAADRRAPRLCHAPHQDHRPVRACGRAALLNRIKEGRGWDNSLLRTRIFLPFLCVCLCVFFFGGEE